MLNRLLRRRCPVANTNGRGAAHEKIDVRGSARGRRRRRVENCGRSEGAARQAEVRHRPQHDNAPGPPKGRPALHHGATAPARRQRGCTARWPARQDGSAPVRQSGCGSPSVDPQCTVLMMPFAMRAKTPIVDSGQSWRPGKIRNMNILGAAVTSCVIAERHLPHMQVSGAAC
jgi:hypothetical protein